MRKISISTAIVSAILGISAGMVQAEYVEALDIYQYSVGGTISWQHTYDHSADPVTSATLTIVADDVDEDEDDMVYFNGHYLGNLNDMGFYTDWSYHPGPGNPNQPITTTVFSLDPSWIDTTMPVSVKVESLWGVEIETSTLTVVPEPATLSLLAVGAMALIRRRRK